MFRAVNLEDYVPSFIKIRCPNVKTTRRHCDWFSLKYVGVISATIVIIFKQ